MPRSLLKAGPKVPPTPVKAKRVSTFQEFESNTSDAWDAGEDDDGLLAMAAESLNSEVVMETAHRVLRSHSQRQEQLKQQEPPPAPSGDLRLVKSVSESHTSCPAGGRGLGLACVSAEGASPSAVGGAGSGAGGAALKALKDVTRVALGLLRQKEPPAPLWGLEAETGYGRRGLSGGPSWARAAGSSPGRMWWGAEGAAAVS